MHDSTSCWLQVSAGQGPDECGLAVAAVSARILAEATEHGLQAVLTDAVPGHYSGTLLSALITVQGATPDGFIARWQGTVQWICPSLLRPGHKRKNWFIGVVALRPNPIDQSQLQERDIVFEAMRASGPGGQHVNKTESAVRATHKPTGLVAVAREERSQHMNKKLAMARLAAMLAQQRQNAQVAARQELWSQHNQLERGNPVRVFTGPDFMEKESLGWR